jgi:hypothetical protein
MQNLELQLPPGDDDALIARIDRAIAKAGLFVSMRGTLKKFPGSIHLHLKQEKEAGTLEITFWPAERRAWLSIQDGRRGTWIEAKTAELRGLIE